MSDFQENSIHNNDDSQELQEQEEEEEEEEGKKYKKKKKKIKKAKQMVLIPLKTIQRLYKNNPNPNLNPNNKATSLAGHGKINGGGGGDVGWAGCNLCFMHPLVHQDGDTSSSPKSQTSDPNNEELCYDFLKVFMETNDFYSSDCNVHIADITDSNVV